MASGFKRSCIPIFAVAYFFFCVDAHPDVPADQLAYGGLVVSSCYEYPTFWRGSKKLQAMPMRIERDSFASKRLNKTAVVEELDEYIEAMPQECTGWQDALYARKQALSNFGYNCSTCEYVLSAQAQHVCFTLGMSELAYTQAYEGNSLDVVLQQEARAILEHAARMTLHPHLMHVHWLAESIAQVNDAGLYYTRGHAYQGAFTCFDWCWSALSTVPALLAGTIHGARDGALAAISLVVHPLDTVRDFAQSIMALGWYTARVLLHATTYHEPLMACMRVQQLTDDALFLHNVAEHIYSESAKLSAYGAARMLSATLVEQFATAKLLRGISSFMRGAAKHASHMKRIPQAEQRLPALSGMPHAYQEAAVQGIEHGLSYLDWAGNDPSKASKKLRGYISKSHYAQRCERIKAKALPALIATAQDLHISISPERIAHVIWGELTGDMLSGCHTQSGLKLHRLEQKCIHNLPGGAYKVEVKVGGKWRVKTIFPDHWTHVEILENIRKALNSPLRRDKLSIGCRVRLYTQTQEGLLIEVIAENNGTIVTAYPVQKMAYANE